jgi:nitroreductase
MKVTVDCAKNGNDILFYNAPAVMVFYTSEIYDSTDSVIAATLATTAAEALGLGSCIIGTATPIINNSPKLKKQYGIAKDEKATISIILGYPQEKAPKGIKREFKEVNYID